MQKDDSELIKKAMNLESFRYKTYKRFSKEIINREVKEILIKLAKIEKKHYNILKKQISSIKKFNKANLDLLNSNKIILSKKEVNYKAMSRIKSDIDLMKEVENIEKGDVKFYDDLANKTKDKDLKKIFLFLKREEANHIKIVREKLTELNKLNARLSIARDPRAMFYEMVGGG